MMKHETWFGRGIVVVAIAAAVGCAKPEAAGPRAKAKDENPKASPVAAVETPKENGHGWWCDEHGIPEAECSMCSPKVAKAFKDKGDWCEKHDRAKSQCFVCDPSLKEKYAALHRAKYGKEPPPIAEETPKKDPE